MAATVLAVAAIAVIRAQDPAGAARLDGYGSSLAGGRTTGTTSAFTISGSVAGLYPGARTTLRLTLTNHESFGIAVTSVTTTVGNASTGCLAANLTVAAFAGDRVVSALRTATVTVAVAVRHSAPNACQGALFPLQYRGVARKA